MTFAANDSGEARFHCRSAQREWNEEDLTGSPAQLLETGLESAGAVERRRPDPGLSEPQFRRRRGRRQLRASVSRRPIVPGRVLAFCKSRRLHRCATESDADARAALETLAARPRLRDDLPDERLHHEFLLHNTDLAAGLHDCDLRLPQSLPTERRDDAWPNLFRVLALWRRCPVVGYRDCRWDQKRGGEHGQEPR